VDSVGSAILSAKRLEAADTTFIGKIFDKAKAAPGVAAKVGRKAAEGAKKVGRGAARGARGVGRGADAGVNFSLAGMSADQEEYQLSADAVQAAIGDPDSDDESFQDELNGAGVAASDLKALAIAKRGVIREYLAGMIMTPGVNDTIMGRKRPVSKMEAHRFNGVKYILDNPKDASELLSEGKLTNEQAKAMRVVWPSIYQDLQVMALENMQRLGEDGKTISFQKRVRLGLMLQIPTDALMGYKMIQEMQSWAQQKTVAPQPPQQRRAPKLNRAVMSESERTQEGTK